MSAKTKTDPNLLKLKVALATGGLMATMIGAGLLGRQAGVVAASGTTAVNLDAAITTGSDTAVSLDAAIPEALNLELEAVPTVAAPTFSNFRVGMGRSSG